MNSVARSGIRYLFARSRGCGEPEPVYDDCVCGDCGITEMNGYGIKNK
jgi:hypothetical protein